jgi:hypothetical protein
VSLGLAAQVWAAALSPVEQEHLDQARQTQALSFADHLPVAPSVQERPARRPAVGQRSLAALAAALFVVGAALTFLGEGSVLATGVIALVAFVAVGAVELLRPEVLD